MMRYDYPASREVEATIALMRYGARGELVLSSSLQIGIAEAPKHAKLVVVRNLVIEAHVADLVPNKG